MLSRRHRRRPWADDDGRNGYSMFRKLAAHWRPVAAELREADANEARQSRHEPAARKTLPSCWSPWLLIK